jgi:hypothetical protein
MSDKASAYAALVGVEAMGTTQPPSTPNCKDSGLLRVSAGKPDESLMMQKLEGKQSCGTEMPPGGKLTDAQLTQVRTWIKNGAKDD